MYNQQFLCMVVAIKTSLNFFAEERRGLDPQSQVGNGQSAQSMRYLCLHYCSKRTWGCPICVDQ